MDSHHVIQCNMNAMLCEQMIVIELKKSEQYCPNNAGDNVHSCPRLTLFSQPECQGKFWTLLLNPWALVCASEIQIFQFPHKLSENDKMFQFRSSKHKLGRGFQTQDNERFVHFRSEPSLTLFQTYWNLNYFSNLIEIWITFQILLKSEFQKKFMSIYNSS